MSRKTIFLIIVADKAWLNQNQISVSLLDWNKNVKQVKRPLLESSWFSK